MHTTIASPLNLINRNLNARILSAIHQPLQHPSYSLYSYSHQSQTNPPHAPVRHQKLNVLDPWLVQSYAISNHAKLA